MKRGWRTCYSDESNHLTRYTFDEVVQAIQSGAKVQKEVSLLTKTTYISIGGKVMLCKDATEVELKEQRALEEQAHYDRAIKKIEARNRAKMRRK